jgi:hypothetical protein
MFKLLGIMQYHIYYIYSKNIYSKDKYTENF